MYFLYVPFPLVDKPQESLGVTVQTIQSHTNEHPHTRKESSVWLCFLFKYINVTFMLPV